jgi:hypothetical protein
LYGTHDHGAVEEREAGHEERDERGSSGLIKRLGFALPMTGLIRGFAVQSLGIPDAWTQGPVVHFKDVKRMDDSNGADGSDLPGLPGIKS